ncbi:MAG: AMP-binding protein, partial [Ignavibacteria bacterium]|nr:AMP-binding protein [Ignavibacteria bacterium]
MAETKFTSLEKERRVFRPYRAFSSRAHIKSMSQYKKLYAESVKSPEKFWAKIAGELHWFKKWGKVLDWKLPHAKWFVGGKINISYNCVDRHLNSWRRNKAAIIWEGENGETATWTYLELHRQVCKFANVLKRLGIKKKDRVCIYMPMIPEIVVAMLACARIGAVHTVVFGGFSASALVDRINDASARLVITADGGYRRGNIVRLKDSVDEAILSCPTVENVIVVKRTGQPINFNS